MVPARTRTGVLDRLPTHALFQLKPFGERRDVTVDGCGGVGAERLPELGRVDSPLPLYALRRTGTGGVGAPGDRGRPTVPNRPPIRVLLVVPEVPVPVPEAVPLVVDPGRRAPTEPATG